MSKTRVFKIITKKNLEKILLSSDNEEVLEQVRLECDLKQVDTDSIQNFLCKQGEKFDENQKTASITQEITLFNDKKNTSFTIAIETKNYKKRIERNNSKQISKSQNIFKNSKLIKYLLGKKQEIQDLREEINNLEARLKEVINIDSRQNTIFVIYQQRFWLSRDAGFAFARAAEEYLYR